jgi:transcriptional regulator with XRE-family HTH domain
MSGTALDKFVAEGEGMRLFQQERLAAEITELMCRTMRERGVKRSQLAQLLHKSKGRISQILNAETNLTLRTVADIFTVLGKTLTVAAEDLFVHREPLRFLVEYGQEIFVAARVPYQMGDDLLPQTGDSHTQLAG